jgi:hypothetical protein
MSQVRSVTYVSGLERAGNNPSSLSLRSASPDTLHPSVWVAAPREARRVALGALPFERPKLAVVANVNAFAGRMEEIARRIGRSNVIDAKPDRLMLRD